MLIQKLRGARVAAPIPVVESWRGNKEDVKKDVLDSLPPLKVPTFADFGQLTNRRHAGRNSCACCPPCLLAQGNGLSLHAALALQKAGGSS